jgi:peptide/nickel transport system substrate-binding protein
LGVLAPVAENPRTVWYNRNLRPYPYDPNKARQLLDAAGWDLDQSGFRVKDGHRLELVFSTTAGNHTREQAQLFLQSAWHDIGVAVDIKNSPAAVLYAPAKSAGPMFSGNFDIAINGNVSEVDPSLRNVNGADAIPPTGLNFSRFADAELTRLEDEGASTYDFPARTKIYDRIQEIELRDLPYYVLRWNQIISVHTPKLHGVRPSMTESTFWNVSQWTITGS